jgi:hypothetical protein
MLRRLLEYKCLWNNWSLFSTKNLAHFVWYGLSVLNTKPIFKPLDMIDLMDGRGDLFKQTGNLQDLINFNDDLLIIPTIPKI